MKFRKSSGCLIFLVSAVLSQPAYSVNHIMQIEQVIGGVNGDVTVQAVQLRMRSSSQQFISGTRIRVRDASGANPVLLITFGSSVTGGTCSFNPTNSRILIASANFNNFTSPSATPDFTLSNLIPESPQETRNPRHTQSIEERTQLRLPPEFFLGRLNPKSFPLSLKAVGKGPKPPRAGYGPQAVGSEPFPTASLKVSELGIFPHLSLVEQRALWRQVRCATLTPKLTLCLRPPIRRVKIPARPATQNTTKKLGRKGVLHMPTEEQTKRSAGQAFMDRLNEWTAQYVIGPVREAFQEYDSKTEVPEDTREKVLDGKLADVQKAIREKVLQSYRNGQKAGPRPEKKKGSK